MSEALEEYCEGFIKTSGVFIHVPEPGCDRWHPCRTLRTGVWYGAKGLEPSALSCPKSVSWRLKSQKSTQLKKPKQPDKTQALSRTHFLFILVLTLNSASFCILMQEVSSVPTPPQRWRREAVAWGLYKCPSLCYKAQKKAKHFQALCEYSAILIAAPGKARPTTKHKYQKQKQKQTNNNKKKPHTTISLWP